MKPMDERDRLREMLRAVADHGVSAIRCEWILDDEGNGRMIVTHSAGDDAEKAAIATIVNHLRSMNATVADNVEPVAADDLPESDE